MRFLIKLLRTFKNWGFLVVVILPIIIIKFIEFPGEYSHYYSELKDMIEFLSWLFSGVMTLITFLTIFIAYTYENKLSVASKSMKTILNPYGLNSDQLRQLLVDYRNAVENDKIIKVIFYGFIIISFFSILVWGIAVGFYTSFQYSFNPKMDVTNMLVFGVYSFYIIIIFMFVFLMVMLKLIILKKDPLNKGFLPPPKKVIDLYFLLYKKGDIEELFEKNPISIDFYKNPINYKQFKYELLVSMPISIINVKFVVNFYDEKKESLFSIYGQTKESIGEMEFAKRYSEHVTNNFEEKIYKDLNKHCYGEYKIYDKELNMIAMYLLSPSFVSEDNITFTILRRLNFYKRKDNYGDIFNTLKSEDNRIKYQIETKSIQ